MAEKRIATTITAPGLIMFWVSIFAIPIGVFSYSGPVLVLGVLGLVILALARYFSRQQLEGLSVERALPKRVFPGEEFQIQARIENPNTRLPIRDCLMVDKIRGRISDPLFVELVQPRSIRNLVYVTRLFQRGKVSMDWYEIRSGWPFGLFESVLRDRFTPMRSGDESMLVIPKPIVPRFIDRILRHIEQESALFSQFNPEEPTEFRALRDYRSGDPVRSIHWSASSRMNQLIVRESDPPIPKPQCHGLLLHQYLPKGEINQPDRFEKMLRIASGLLLRFRQRNVALIVRIEFPERRWFYIPSKHSYDQVLDVLAEARACPRSNLSFLESEWEPFAECDQVFVLGDSNLKLWQTATAGKHASIIGIDPVSASPPVTRRTLAAGGKLKRKVLLTDAS